MPGPHELTYRACTPNGVAAAAGAAMFFVIAGSATKEVRVHRLWISGFHLTTLAVGTVVAEKWSSAPSGGTATALTAVPNDSLYAASTASLVQVYTVAPTEGTLVGTVASRRTMWKSATVVDGAEFPAVEFLFGDQPNTEPIILRGTAECLSLAFGAAPASALSVAIEVEWTEV